MLGSHRIICGKATHSPSPTIILPQPVFGSINYSYLFRLPWLKSTRNTLPAEAYISARFSFHPPFNFAYFRVATLLYIVVYLIFHLLVELSRYSLKLHWRAFKRGESPSFFFFPLSLPGTLPKKNCIHVTLSVAKGLGVVGTICAPPARPTDSSLLCSSEWRKGRGMTRNCSE